MLLLCSLGCGDLVLTLKCFFLSFLAQAPSTQTVKALSKAKVAPAGKGALNRKQQAAAD
jgi:hypothetical protein